MFQDIKSLTNIKQIIEYYHSKLIRNKCICPFHSEKSGSLSVHEKKQIFKCFGCGVGGDSITFVARLFNISNIDACKKISDDFNLGLTAEKLDNKKIEAYKKKKKAEQDFLNWEKYIYLQLAELYRIIHRMSDLEDIKIKYFMQIEYLCDVFASDNVKAKIKNHDVQEYIDVVKEAVYECRRFRIV